MAVHLLNERLFFPSPSRASREGLLAVGGDLSTDRLLLAYRMGIFPWYSRGEPILWWSPDPRMVLYPEDLHVPRRLYRTIRQGRFRISFDTAFERVITGCAGVRNEKRQDTWIVREMITAYCALHDAGFAHCVEAWEGTRLVGGLYGVSLGACFFGESMFSLVSGASKVAFVALVEQLRGWGFRLIDCQVSNPHLERFGARDIRRSRFLSELESALRAPTRTGRWRFDASCRKDGGGRRLTCSQHIENTQ